MLDINEDQLKKITFGVGGMAAGTLAMKAIQNTMGLKGVEDLLGFEGVNTLKDIAPPLLVGILGAAYFAQNSKKNIGYIGLGAAMAAGAKVIEKVANKTIFSGIGATDVEYMDGTEDLDYQPFEYSETDEEAVDGIDGVDDIDIL